MTQTVATTVALNSPNTGGSPAVSSLTISHGDGRKHINGLISSAVPVETIFGKNGHDVRDAIYAANRPLPGCTMTAARRPTGHAL